MVDMCRPAAAPVHWHSIMCDTITPGLSQAQDDRTWRVLDAVVEVCEGVVVLHFHDGRHLLRRILKCLQSLRPCHAIDSQIWLLRIGPQQVLYEGGPATQEDISHMLPDPLSSCPLAFTSCIKMALRGQQHFAVHGDGIGGSSRNLLDLASLHVLVFKAV